MKIQARFKPLMWVKIGYQVDQIVGMSDGTYTFRALIPPQRIDKVDRIAREATKNEVLYQTGYHLSEVQYLSDKLACQVLSLDNLPEELIEVVEELLTCTQIEVENEKYIR